MLSFSYLGRYPTKNIFTSHVCDAAVQQMTAAIEAKIMSKSLLLNFIFPTPAALQVLYLLKVRSRNTNGLKNHQGRYQEHWPERAMSIYSARVYIRLISLKVHSPVVVVLDVKSKLGSATQPILYFKEKGNEPQISEPIIYNRIIDAKTGKNPQCAPNVKLVCGGSVLCGVQLYTFIIT
jgi:hypothetical protein